MKTLYGYLINEETKKVNHKDLDKLAVLIKEKANEKYEFETETHKAFFRFNACLLHWLAEEVNPEEVSWLSFLKLVGCEIEKDGTKPQDCKTVFDILMEEASEKSPVIYQLYEFYRPFDQHMPAFDIIVDGIDMACEELEIEFARETDLEELERIQAERAEEQAKKEAKSREKFEVTSEDIRLNRAERLLNEKEEDLNSVRKALICLNTLRTDEFKFDYIEEAWENIREINNEDLLKEMTEFLTYYEEYNDVIKAIHEYAINQ